jgi:hypothetical protein
MLKIQVSFLKIQLLVEHNKLLFLLILYITVFWSVRRINGWRIFFKEKERLTRLIKRCNSISDDAAKIVVVAI